MPVRTKVQEPDLRARKGAKRALSQQQSSPADNSGAQRHRGQHFLPMGNAQPWASPSVGPPDIHQRHWACPHGPFCERMGAPCAFRELRTDCTTPSISYIFCSNPARPLLRCCEMPLAPTRAPIMAPRTAPRLVLCPPRFALASSAPSKSLPYFEAKNSATFK